MDSTTTNVDPEPKPDQPKSDLFRVVLKNKAWEHIIANNDPRGLPRKVLSFFAPHLCALADGRHKNNAGVMETVSTWNITRDEKDWRWKPPGDKNPKYGNRMSGHDMDPTCIVIDIFTAALLGLTDSETKPEVFNLVWDQSSGMVQSVMIWYKNDKFMSVCETVLSAKSARRASIRRFIREKQQLDFTGGTLEWFARKIAKERRYATRDYDTERAKKYLERHKNVDEPTVPAIESAPSAQEISTDEPIEPSVTEID